MPPGVTSIIGILGVILSTLGAVGASTLSTLGVIYIVWMSFVPLDIILSPMVSLMAHWLHVQMLSMKNNRQYILLQSSHKCIHDADVERVKEMFKQVPTARIKELLENHDVHTTVEILIGEASVKSDTDDDDSFPVIDLTVSRQPYVQ